MKRVGLLVVLLALGGWDLFESPNPKVEKGNAAFKDGRYDEAISSYREALKDLPNEPGIHFDLGASIYQKGVNAPPGKEQEQLFEEAERELGVATQMGDPKLRSQAHYNLGNTFYQKGDYKEAVRQYKQSIKLDPKNMDARYNLELALRKREPPEQQQQQQQQQGQQGQQGQQQQQQGQGQQNQQNQQNQQQQGSQGQQQQQQQQQGSQGQQQQNPKSQGGGNQQQQQDPQNGQNDQQDQQDQQNDPQQGEDQQKPGEGDSQSDAERKLDALERRSKDLQVNKQRARADERRRGRAVKDW